MPCGHCLRHLFGWIFSRVVCSSGVFKNPHIPLKPLRSYLCFYDFHFQDLIALEVFECLFVFFKSNKAILLK